MVNLNDPNIPILGQHPLGAPQPNHAGLTINCEVYDSEIAEIEGVLDRLNERARNGRVNFDAFDREIKDRFHQIGFKVNVTWYHSNVAETKIPEITITDRTERHEFDYDQQVHEVTNDILDLGDKGVIKTDPAALEAGKGHRH